MAVNRAENEYQRDPSRLVDLLFFDVFGHSFLFI